VADTQFIERDFRNIGSGASCDATRKEQINGCFTSFIFDWCWIVPVWELS